MATAKLEKENVLIMRMHYAEATHPENGEKIDVSVAMNSVAMNGVPVITYKGRIVTYDIQEIVNEAVNLIDEALAKELKNGDN
ncbi:hypothetical protein JQM70_11430 [Streptococcus pasteurianus]|nr:hypothetical protein [Streptococcus pasteurianus]